MAWYQKYWIVLLMVTLLGLSILVAVIRGVGNSMNTGSYVPLERDCPDYWERKEIQDDSGNKRAVCHTSDTKLQPLATCLDTVPDLNVNAVLTTSDPKRVQQMDIVTDRDAKTEIAKNCQLPWDGISYRSAANIQQPEPSPSCKEEFHAF